MTAARAAGRGGAPAPAGPRAAQGRVSLSPLTFRGALASQAPAWGDTWLQGQERPSHQCQSPPTPTGTGSRASPQLFPSLGGVGRGI